MLKKSRIIIIAIIVCISALLFCYWQTDTVQINSYLKNLIAAKMSVYEQIEIENKSNTRFTDTLTAALVNAEGNNKWDSLTSIIKLTTARVSYKTTEGEKAALTNAPKRLLLTDACGSNDAYHPKIISFAQAWHGYKYWLVYSPFPDGNEKYENPHLKASNDLLHWEEPSGFQNPLEGIPENFFPKKVYNSDPHILYNDAQDQIEVWWRFVDDLADQVIIYRSVSRDGVSWSDKEAVLTAVRSKADYLSPAIICEDGLYKVWYVKKYRQLAYMESADLTTWQNQHEIDMQYAAGKLTNWHLDVIHTAKGYEMVISAYTEWKRRNFMNLYYSCSADNIHYSKAATILYPTAKTDYWDNRGIYRSSLLFENGQYYLFYSASSNYGTEGIGLLTGTEITALRYCVNQ